MKNKNSKIEFTEKRRALKELILTFFLLIGMLLPGIILDGTYYFRHTYDLDAWVVSKFYSFFKPMGVTYTTAFNILSSNVGVLLAMVSLFLTMNINIAQRSEKRIMGIPYREIQDINRSFFYMLTRRIGYLAPILMLIVLNLHLCVTGYFLFCYCYGFLIIHYYYHTSSYSAEWTKVKVTRRLLKCLPEAEEWDSNELQEFDMYLEEVGRGIEDDGNWREAEQVYEKLDELSCVYKADQRQIILNHFYGIVYWNRIKPNMIAIFRLWNLSLEKVDRKLAKNKQISAADWVFLWAMLKIIVYEADENDLQLFLESFLQFKLRSSKTLKSEGEELPDELLYEQSGAVIVLLEYRLRDRLPKEESVVWYFKRLVNYGGRVFVFQEYHIVDTIKFLAAADERNQAKFLEITDDLCVDFRNNTTRWSLVTL